MGVGLIGELKPIPWAHRDRLDVVISWITQHAPCVVGRISPEVTDEIIWELRKRHVSNPVIAAALLYLRRQGTYEFAVNIQSAKIGYGLEYTPPRPVSETRMGPRSEQRMDLATARYHAERHENAFIKAQSAGDTAGMEAAVVAVLTLLWEFLKGRGEVKGEQDKIDEAAAEVLRNAANMRSIVRQLGPGELVRLRQSPTPPNPRNLRFHIPPRPVRVRRSR